MHDIQTHNKIKITTLTSVTMEAQRAHYTISLTQTHSYSAYKGNHSSFSLLQNITSTKPYVRNDVRHN